MTRRAVRVGGVFALALSAAAFAQRATTERILIGADLKRTVARDIEIGPDSISYHDADGRAKMQARDTVLAIAAPESSAPRIESGRREWRETKDSRAQISGRLVYTDGRVLPGTISLSDSAARADHFLWDHGLLGRIGVSLDRVSAMVLRADAAAVAALGASSSDVVELVNGDRVEGFVSSVGREVKIEVGGKPTDFPADRVAFVRFANPAAPPSGARVWLSDGSVVLVASVVTGSGGVLAITLPGDGGTGALVTVPFGDVTAISFDAARLRALSDAKLSVLSTPKDRVWSPEPIVGRAPGLPLGAGDIELPGPMTVEWVLPIGASRVAGVVELPPSCRAWGDCTLALEAGGKEVFRTRLNGAKFEAEFAVDLSAGGPTRLRAVLDAGESGPIQDRVIFRGALVRVEKTK